MFTQALDYDTFIAEMIRFSVLTSYVRFTCLFVVTETAGVCCFLPYPLLSDDRT